MRALRVALLSILAAMAIVTIAIIRASAKLMSKVKVT